MPVEVAGQSVNGKAFRQETRTTAVNAHGAQLILAMTVEMQPSILLRNTKTGAEAQCRVVYQKRVESEKAELGIEFLEPQPRFWGIALLVGYMLVRTAFLTTVEAPEPRYVVTCYPVILALAALCWARKQE